MRRHSISETGAVDRPQNDARSSGFRDSGAASVTQRSNQFDQIQVLRGYAATSVALLHVLYKLDPAVGTNYFNNVWYDLGSGVDVFFVLSGFIIVYVSGRHFGNPAYRRVFLYRRITRIIPIYWFYTTLMLVLILLAPRIVPQSSTTPMHAIASYLFLPWPDAHGRIGPVLGLGWTLLYEMMFYAIFALLVGFRMWRAIWITALLFSALVLLRVFWGAPLPFYLDYWSNPIILEFVAGAVIGGLFLQHDNRFDWRIGIALTAVAFAWYIAAEQVDSLTTQQRIFRLGIPSALMVFAFTFCTKGIPEGLKWPRWMIEVGDSSYSLYLSHFFTIGAALAVLKGLNLLPLLPPLVWIPLLLGFCALAGILSYRLIEKPALTLARANEARLMGRLRVD